MLLRPLATQFSKLTGKALVIDNCGGAGGTLGASVAAKAPADGYIAVHGRCAPRGRAQHVPQARLRHRERLRAADPAGQRAAGAFGGEQQAGQHRQLQGFPIRAGPGKEPPGKLDYASAGAGSVHHLAGELFKQQTKTSITHIPYRGAGGRRCRI